MKHTARFLPFMCLSVLLYCASGCSDSGNTDDASTPPKKEKTSSAQLTIDGITGKTAIEAGNRAKAKIGEINAKQEEELKELDSF